MTTQTTMLVEGVLVELFSLTPNDVDLDANRIDFHAVGVILDEPGEKWNILGRVEIGVPMHFGEWTFGDVYRMVEEVS